MELILNENEKEKLTMKNIWKLLGAAAAVAALTPHSWDQDPKTGKRKYTALLWSATVEPKAEGEGKTVSLSLGLNIPTVKMNEEAHLFADDLLVNYHTAAAAVAPQGEAAAESAAEPEAESAPAEEASAEEPAEEEPADGQA